MTNIIFFRPVYKDEEIVVEDEEDVEPSPVSIGTRINCFAGCSSLKLDDDKVEATDQKDSNIDAPFEAEENVTLDVPSGTIQEEVPVWPSWLSPFPMDAIKGWSPRSSNSFEILRKIGQDSRCEVFKGRDIMTGKIVALKKIKLYTWEPEYVEEMAQEILVLRRLDSHPNVGKLEGLVLNQEEPLSFYLVFEYVEHSLADRQVKFTESQVKCYMHQLLLGLEYCHSRGVVHGNINGFNLLISNKGILKIAGFGKAASIDFPNRYKSGMVGEAVPVLYRAPEFSPYHPAYSTNSSAADLWGVGCILAESLATKPITHILREEQHCNPYNKRGRRKNFKGLQGKPASSTLMETLLADNIGFPPSSLTLVETLLADNPVARQSASAALANKVMFPQFCYSKLPQSIPS